jgi:plasmid stabilization system protein ParE
MTGWRLSLRAGVRSVPFESYVIYYRVKSPGVHILRVWGGRQKSERLKREL